MSDEIKNYVDLRDSLLEGLSGKKKVWVSQMMDRAHMVHTTPKYLKEQRDHYGDDIVLGESDLNESVKLETQMKESTSTGSTTTNAITRYDRLFMPLMRRVMPSLFSVELAGTQPLDGPNGNIRTIKKLYGRDVDDGSGNNNIVTAGDEASAQNVYDKYSMLNQTQDYDAFEYDTLDPYAQTIDLEGDRGNPMNLEVVMKQVQTQNRKLSAAFSLESEDDLDALDGLSVESEMLATISDQLRRDMDKEVLERFVSLAGSVRSLDFAQVDGRYAGEKLAAMTISIDDLDADISQKTKNGGSTWMVASPKILVALKNASNSSYVPVDRDGYNVSQSAMVGTYDGKPVYVDNDADSDYYLLGAKYSEQYTGLIYAPYVSLQSSGIITNPDTFDKRLGVRSRYALVDFTDPEDSLANSADFYARASVASLELGFRNN